MSHPASLAPEDWLRVTDGGLYCVPGDFYVDPPGPVDRAVITHGHADHARPGHNNVLATPETLAIMRHRIGPERMGAGQALAYGKPLDIGGVTLRLAPAGHVLGSAQAVLEHAGQRIVVSGDYKRRADPTCAPFEVVTCDVFITEATFGLPVFRHPDAAEEIGKVLRALARDPDGCVLVGVYALGKAQRVIRLLREAGHDAPLYIHGALEGLCGLYEQHGVALGELRPATGADTDDMRGHIVLAPPSAGRDRWARRLPDPVIAMASGWMGVRARARQRGAELPLVISDHADWDELVRTIDDVAAGEIWVTHGREDALIHHCRTRGIRARALSLVGREEEEGE
ncbi:MAG: ligase-associated DNA damage response exonuclease [Alphaproteobacteria bacterium]|nr:ligase-associated DNA damage response exonuclease [Alphaproteobacteria bacterium]